MLRHLFVTIVLSCFFEAGHAQQKRFTFSEPKMGAPLQIIFYDEDSANAKSIAKEAFKLVDSLVYIFSDYIDSSELNRLCATAGKGKYTPVSPPLFEVICQSKIAWEKSSGTFDITLGTLTKLWRKARKTKQFPADSVVQQKLAFTGFEKVKVDTALRSVMMIQAGMQLDLGGIAQGYIAQQVSKFLQGKHILNALVDVSGDIVAVGAPPNTRGWTVGVNLPEDEIALLPKYLLLSNKAVTTSGDVYQFMLHAGKRYSHVIDPRTGYGITSQQNVTVIASDGTTADWLTKACSILPKNKAKKIARSFKADLLVVKMKKGKLVFFTTKGFKHYWKKDK